MTDDTLNSAQEREYEAMKRRALIAEEALNLAAKEYGTHPNLSGSHAKKLGVREAKSRLIASGAIKPMEKESSNG